eukprot:13882938-Alexandrium_andersonii.AAC.1
MPRPDSAPLRPDPPPRPWRCLAQAVRFCSRPLPPPRRCFARAVRRGFGPWLRIPPCASPAEVRAVSGGSRTRPSS